MIRHFVGDMAHVVCKQTSVLGLGSRRKSAKISDDSSLVTDQFETAATFCAAQWLAELQTSVFYRVLKLRDRLKSM